MLKRGFLYRMVVCALVGFSAVAESQQAPTPTNNSTTTVFVPRLIRFSGTLVDEQGHALKGPVGVVFSLYGEQPGSAALWMEMQNVEGDTNGNYTVLVGSASSNGIPEELFSSGEARWLGVQPQGQAEQPRVLLVSVPYALKAGDAETLGGLPASAFLTAGSQVSPQGAAQTSSTVPRSGAATAASSLPPAVHGTGAANFIPIWMDSSTIGDSSLFQIGGNVGIGTTTPGSTLDVNGSVNAAGSVSGVSGIFAAKVAGSQLVSTVGTGTAPLVVTSTTQVPNLNASLLGGTAASGFATIGVNSFTGNQNVNGNVSATGSVSGGSASFTATVSGNQFVSTAGTGTPPFVVNSTTQVPNLNASFVGGVGVGNFATLGANSFVGNQNIAGIVKANAGNAAISIEGDSNSGDGVVGTSNSGDGLVGTSGSVNGVLGISSGGGILAAAGVFGQDDAFNGNGVIGSANGLGGIGVYGSANSNVNPAGSIGVVGTSHDGTGVVGNSATGDGVLGESESATAFAGDFAGNLNVSLSITAGVKDFRIDHPLDPANRYLYHSSVESSEMKNIYDGVVTLDANGMAVIDLPVWFETLNRDFRYQLTAVGAPAPGLYIGQEIANHQFKIAGGSAGLKVSWQVTGVRQDAFAKAHPLQVDVEKPEGERGFYIHPELYGAPAEKSMQWARHPEVMRRLQATRPSQSTTP